MRTFLRQAVLFTTLTIAPGCGGDATLVSSDGGDVPRASRVAVVKPVRFLQSSSSPAALDLDVLVHVEGSPASGVDVQLTRSVAGRPLDFLWSGVTDAAGRTQIRITADGVDRGFGVRGYYIARVVDQADNELGRWGSIPVNALETRELVLSTGARAVFEVLAPENADTPSAPPGFPVPNPDCRFCDLEGLDLRNTQLIQADLYGANLTRVDFRGSDMYEVDLRTADLTEANLFETYVEGTRANGARFNRANLGGADLSRADLQDADLQDADLSRADLRTADLRNANLRGANVSGTNFENANLVGAIWTDGSQCGSGSIGTCVR